MNAAPDVVGLYRVLADSPDVTARQRARYLASAEIAAAAAEYPDDDEGDFEEDAADWALGRLRDVKLSKTARRAVEDALGVDR